MAERAQHAANRKKHLQIKKTTSSILQSTRCKCSQHNQKKKRAANKMIYLFVLWAFAVCFFICLCCEHLQHLLSNWWRCFLDLLVLFLFACVFWSCSALSSLGHRMLLLKWLYFFVKERKKERKEEKTKVGCGGLKILGDIAAGKERERVCRLKEMEREWGRLWCSCEGIIWSPMPPKLRHGAWNIYLTQQSAKPETNKKYRQTRSLRGRRWLSKKSLHFLCTHLFYY